MKKNILIGFLLVVVVTLGVFSYTGTKASGSLETTVTNNYEKSLSSLLESFEQMNSRLSKLSVSNDDKFIKKELVNLYGLNLSINENINSLPINHSAVVEASKFLNKTTNYYYSLITSNKKITSENKDDIKNIYTASDKIFKSLDEMNNEIRYSKDGYNWIKNSNVFMADTSTKIDNSFKATNEEINEYPTLIFDGPFSDSIKTDEKIKVGSKNITKEEGLETVRKYIGSKAEVSYDSFDNSNIECYVYKYNLNDVSYYVYVSKSGGKIITVNSNYLADENSNRAIDIKEAIFIGKKHLDSMGIKNMEENYYETDSNVVTVNYAYNKDGVTCYPDLVKVKISLVNKSIVGIEATNYYTNHKQRNINKKILSMKNARNKISKDFKITKERLAIIPTETNSEKLCYEFKGTKDKETFIIYINAKTGDEENILKVVEADDSILTM